MANTTEFLSFLTGELSCGTAGRSFAPYVEVSKEADALTVYFKGDADYSQRLTDHVTLYLSIDTNEIVGCRIKGIMGLLEDLPNYIEVAHDDVKLRLIFWSLRGSAADEETRRAFNRLVEAAGDLEVPALAE